MRELDASPAPWPSALPPFTSADRTLGAAEERLAAREPVDEGALRGVDAAREALARPQRLGWGRGSG